MVGKFETDTRFFRTTVTTRPPPHAFTSAPLPPKRTLQTVRPSGQPARARGEECNRAAGGLWH
eukprot:10165509-Lingulodinium_polyedra.AAC.1